MSQLSKQPREKIAVMGRGHHNVRTVERMIVQQTRSIKRLVLGIFSIALGVISLAAFFSITYIAGVGFLGGFYRFVLIALGVGLILPRKENQAGEG